MLCGLHFLENKDSWKRQFCSMETEKSTILLQPAIYNQVKNFQNISSSFRGRFF